MTPNFFSDFIQNPEKYLKKQETETPAEKAWRLYQECPQINPGEKLRLLNEALKLQNGLK